MTQMHPLTAAGIALSVGAVGLAVAGVRGLLFTGVLVAVAGVALGDPRSSDGPERCPHCDTRKPGTPYCRWCDRDVRDVRDGRDPDDTPDVSAP